MVKTDLTYLVCPLPMNMTPPYQGVSHTTHHTGEEAMAGCAQGQSGFAWAVPNTLYCALSEKLGMERWVL